MIFGMADSAFSFRRALVLLVLMVLLVLDLSISGWRIELKLVSRFPAYFCRRRLQSWVQERSTLSHLLRVIFRVTL